jgi:hypothetical protein
VFRTGPVRNGAVQGDLVLVASGDFDGAAGAAERDHGLLPAPSVDHTYANTGLPAIEVGNDPLTGGTTRAAGRRLRHHEGQGRRHRR